MVSQLQSPGRTYQVLLPRRRRATVMASHSHTSSPPTVRSCLACLLSPSPPRATPPLVGNPQRAIPRGLSVPQAGSRKDRDGLGRLSTAQDVLDGKDLSGMTFFVSGGNSGIGYATTRALSQCGARVLFTSRSLKRAQQAAERLQHEGAKGELLPLELELGDLDVVDEVAERLSAEPRLDALILCGGCCANPLSYTRHGFEEHIGVNHFGYAALVDALLPKLKSQAHPSRVVLFGSIGHRLQRKPLPLDDLHFRHRWYQRFLGYGQSKFAAILFASELSRRLQDSPVSVYALHPGAVDTPLSRQLLPPVITHVIFALASWLQVLKDPDQGAATPVYAATAPELEGRSGVYLADCHQIQPKKGSQDPDDAKALWDVTFEQLREARQRAGHDAAHPTHA